MATRIRYQCAECGKNTGVGPSKRLFELLLNFPKSVPNCICGGKNDLRLTPKFALGADEVCYRVLDAFHESISWMKADIQVTFYPFLIVGEEIEGSKQGMWLPYWHVDGSTTKFGERAPWMDASLFDGLLAKANAKGYFRKAA